MSLNYFEHTQIFIFCMYVISQYLKYGKLSTMFRCVSCGNKHVIEDRVIDGHLLMRCDRCGLLLTQTTEQARTTYIKQKYSQQYTEDYKNALPKLHERFARHMKLVHKYIAGGKILDVGCGTGYFLKFLKDTYAMWQIFGVEPSPLLRKVATKNTGKNIKPGLLNNIPFSNNYFDVVTCYDVLEHSVDLKKNVQELRRVLKPGGFLLVQAPNYKSFMAYITGKTWDWWCIPDHVLHFSYDFLTRYLKKNGFSIVQSYTYEDQADFVSNCKGKFTSNYVTKVMFYLFLPFLILGERIGWLMNKGGLNVVLARKI